MSDVVDRLRVGVLGMVTDSEGQAMKVDFAIDHYGAEDHAPLPVGVRDVNLGAVGQLGPVAPHRFAGFQVGDRNTTGFVFASSDRGARLSGRGRVCEVLVEHVGIEPRRKCGSEGDSGTSYPSPSGGCICGPYSAQKASDSSAVISRPPERSSISAHVTVG